MFPRRTNAVLKHFVVNEERVRKEILDLNINKSCGPDEIHPRLLYELVNEIVAPLTLLFQKTLNDGNIPSDWGKAYVTPIYKKGKKNIAENYRPISLTSIPCKIMEKIVKEGIMHHLLNNSLLSSKQFAFLNGRSTVTQLLKFLDDCMKIIVKGGVVDTIYMDFSKAFDKVPHRRLLHKLKAYGVNGPALNWIKAFLSNREQIVTVNGEKSYQASVLSGVPQGSVLGPLLFLVYINDLPEHVSSLIYLFADDTKIANKVASAKDAEQIQDDLNSLSNWSSTWFLEFNAKKCHVLTLGHIDNITHTERYKINDKELEHVFEEKDLGVIMDFQLTFEEHIGQKVKTANTMMGLIRRSFSFLDPHLFRKLYVSFVRPHLEYAQAVWAPHLSKHVNMIENVQKRATSMVDGLRDIEYNDRLQLINIPTLSMRRARGDMIEVWKHFHIYDRSTVANAFRPRPRVTRRHKLQLFNNRSLDGVRGIQRNSFYHRTVDVWNQLPSYVAESKTINNFKNNLDRYWSEIPPM